MDNKRNRAELKYFFRSKNIPTQENFADLIRSTINYADDGLRKQDGDPLSIEAQGDNGTQKKALSFFNSFDDQQPNWVVNLSPRVNPEIASNTKTGFSLSDTDSSGLLYSRFFISRENGRVGINTVEPTEQLHVNGRIQAQELVLGRLDESDGDKIFLGHMQDDKDSLTNSYALAQDDYGKTTLNSSHQIDFSINNYDLLALNKQGFHISGGMSINHDDAFFGYIKPAASLQVGRDILVTDGGYELQMAVQISSDSINCVQFEENEYEHYNNNEHAYTERFSLQLQQTGGKTVLGGDLEIKGKIIQEKWIPITFSTGSKWRDTYDHQRSGFYKDSLGMVHLRGSIIDGEWSGAVSQLIITTLPQGYWPETRLPFLVLGKGPEPTRVDITPEGQVIMVVEGSWKASKFVSLNGISFKAADENKAEG